MQARQQQQAQAQALGARLTPQLREASPGLYENPAWLLLQRTPPPHDVLHRLGCLAKE